MHAISCVSSDLDSRVRLEKYGKILTMDQIPRRVNTNYTVKLLSEIPQRLKNHCTVNLLSELAHLTALYLLLPRDQLLNPWLGRRRGVLAAHIKIKEFRSLFEMNAA